MPRRPVMGGLTVPYVIDPSYDPPRFATLSMARVKKCAKERRCAICGKPIPGGQYVAFIGPDDGRRCFADVWMDARCARQAMEQCPFLKGRDFKKAADQGDDLLQPYREGRALFLAPDGRAYLDQFGHWHFEALGVLRRG